MAVTRSSLVWRSSTDLLDMIASASEALGEATIHSFSTCHFSARPAAWQNEYHKRQRTQERPRSLQAEPAEAPVKLMLPTRVTMRPAAAEKDKPKLARVRPTIREP